MKEYLGKDTIPGTSPTLMGGFEDIFLICRRERVKI